MEVLFYLETQEKYIVLHDMTSNVQSFNIWVVPLPLTCPVCEQVLDDNLPVERLKKYLNFIQSIFYTTLLICNDHLNR